MKVNILVRMAKYIFVLCMLLTTVNSQQCDSYGFMGCLEDLYGFIRFTIPTKEAMDNECSNARKNVVPCFEGLQQSCETININTNGLNNYLKALCEAGSFHDEYVKQMKCLSKDQGDLSTCNEYADKHEKERMKYICCAQQNKISDCFRDKANTICGEESASLVYHLNNRTSSIFPRILCEDVDMCDAGSRQSTSWNILRALLIAVLAMLVK